MTTAVNILTSRAATLLEDAGFVHWTQNELVDYLNEGQAKLITIKPDAKVTIANTALVAGAKQTAPAGSISVIDVTRNVGGGVVTRCDKSALDSFDPNWMVAPTAGSVIHWMPDAQPDTYYVYPPQNGTPATVQTTCSVMPNTVAAGGDIDVRDIYAERLVNYMLFRAYSKGGEQINATAAAAYYQLFSA